jgi:signal transduction histidine kinase/ActR/RegA family two-component response regulator
MLDRPSMFDDLPMGVWIGSAPDGATVYANKMCERIFGMRPVEASRIDDVPETYGIFDRNGQPYPIDKLPFTRVLATGAPVVVDDLVARRQEGDVFIRALSAPLFGADGALTHVIVAFLDISKEVEADAQRRLMEERLLLACNHAPMVIWMADADGVITMSEGAGLASLNVKSGQLVGQNVFDLYAGHPTIPGYIRRALRGDSFWYTVEVGEAVYDSWITPLRGPDGQVIGLTAVSNDVSHVRKLQKKAIQNDRVMALGTLAASVAHEINNPLTYVLANSDALADEIDALEAMAGGIEGPAAGNVRASIALIRDKLGPIRSGASRIAGITRDLRTFSRPDESSLVRVDVRTVVESVLRLVNKEVEARAQLVLDLQPTPPTIGNEARLVQVVLNLIVNAYQALPPDAPSHNQVHVATRAEGGQIIIEIGDTGPGVLATDRELIFEPFFSTKEIGQGTGLGLFVCRNIVRGFSGEIDVRDRPGGGALFRVTLPAAAADVAAPIVEATPPARPAIEVAAAGGGRHVVVIDDDAMVARALALQLREAGYRVTTYNDGQAGIEALLATDDVALVFCDLMMTGMTGIEVAERLAADSPALARKLVLMTGGAFSPAAREFVARHRDRTVEKPFDVVAEAHRRLALTRQPN